MLEYVFFHPEPVACFVAYAEQLGLSPAVFNLEDSIEVHVPEDIDESTLDALEEKYSEMLDLSQQIYDATHAKSGEVHNAGVVLNLKNGQTVYAQIDPYLLGRILSAINADEFGQVVNAIVDAVESPDDRPLCKR